MKVIPLIISAAFVVSCASAPREAKKSSPSPTDQAAARVGGSTYVTLEFEKGASRLSDASRRDLNALAAKASQDGRPIEEIKILAWADQEYPDRVQGKAKASQVILAKERAESIKSYLKDDLHAEENIDSFNMAKRPNLASKLIEGEDYSVKEAFEKAGATGTKNNDGAISYSKASKALVIIDYEKTTN